MIKKTKIIKKTKDSIIYEGGYVISRRNIVVGAILCEGVDKSRQG